jgi:hypothetical protein
VGEDREKVRDAEAQREDDADVEAHKVREAAERAATEEGPDVEGHLHKPKAKP